MRKILSVISVFICVALNAQNSNYLNVTSYKLENGMTVWLNEDHTTPTAYGAVVVRAGAKDCPSTGIAHYFEHMMFKGTDKIGTVNYELEKPYLDSIAIMYDKLAATKDDSERASIQKEINRLNIAASKYVIPNEFDALTTACGGSDLNAYTSQDETVFHSGFLPQYFEQWAEINSERLMNPVFRLFQSELETVYEEKNMYSDNILSGAVDKVTEYLFEGTPYAYNVIGTTENLKNPRLSEMAGFFEKYYVANNMGLVISGDFDIETVKPIIEKTFGRIRKGDTVTHTDIKTKAFSGRTDMDLLVDVPLIKAEVICYRTPVMGEEDYEELEIIANMLQNSEGVGLYDKLSNERKILTAGLLNLSFQKAGATCLLILPKLVGQSLKSAEKIALGAIEEIKNGDFDTDFLESCKLSYKRNYLMSLEDKETRVTEIMADAMSRGCDWDEELERINSIDNITKEDIVRVANKYFGSDCLVFTKKKGSYGKDNLVKPGYDKVVPECKDSTSLYASALKAQIAEIVPEIPLIDFSEEVETKQISPLVKLYKSKNPFNDVFDLSIRFMNGTYMNPAYERMASYINNLGTTDMKYDELNGALQSIGSTFIISANANAVTIKMTGFEKNIEKTLELVSKLLTDVKGDSKKIAIIKDEETSEKSLTKKDVSTVAEALFQKVAYGDNSKYLQDKGKLSDDYLLKLWSDIQHKQMDVLYTGNKSADELASLIKKYIDIEKINEKADLPQEKIFKKYDKSEVIFIDMPDAAQSTIVAFIPSDKLTDREKLNVSNIYQSYLGGGMTSLMFQEIREFRSMAYSAGSAIYQPSWKRRNTQGCFIIAEVGTQNDKAAEAVAVVDSLICNFPLTESKFNEKKTEFINEIFFDYPSFRAMANYVEFENVNDLTYDVSKENADIVNAMSIGDLKEFSKNYFEGKPVIWCIAGNSKKVDIEALKKFGPVTFLKVKDVMK